MKIRKRYQWQPFVTALLLLTLFYSTQALCDEFAYDGTQLITQIEEGGVIPESSLLTGAATYQLPIKVPPGRAGMTPEIALMYNSYRGNGIAGVGWAINISSIQRRKKGGVDYSDTNFEYHAGNSVKELVVVSVDSNGYGTYRAKIEENFSEFTFSSNGWVVVSRDGTTYTYGSTSASRQDSGLDIFKWCLDRVEDTNSNFMTYSYWKDQGQIYPQYIEYTGNGNASAAPYFQVAFVYETTTRPDPIISWETLFSVKTTKRLQYIRTYSDIDNGNALVNTYTLQYSTAASSPRTRLSSFQVSGPSAETLPPVEFESRDGGAGTYGTGISAASFEGEEDGRLFIAELNGDGLKDLLLCNDSGIQPALSSGDGTFAIGDATSFPSGSGADELENVYFADINHDGLSDLIIYEFIPAPTGWGFPKDADPTQKINIYLSTGNGNFSFASSIILDYGENEVDTIQFAPVNDDQWTDMIIDNGIYLSNGDGTFTYWDNKSINTAPINSFRSVLDINADGLADAVYTTYLTGWGTGYAAVSVHLGQGNGDFSASVTTQLINPDPYGPTPDAYTKSVHFVEANGDGLTDLLVRGNETSENTIFIFLSKGDGTFVWFGTTSASSSTAPVFFTDTNADGISDQININTLSGWGVEGEIQSVTTRLGAGEGKADLIKTVTNALGAETSLEYTPSIKFQDPAEDPDIPFIVHTLSDVTVNDGLGNTSTSTYEYTNGVYDAAELEFRGFETVVRINPDEETTRTTTFYCADDYRKGKPSETFLKTNSETPTPLEKTTFTWTPSDDLGNGSKFVSLVNKLYEYYDNGSKTADIEEDYTFSGSHGFLIEKSVAHENSSGVTYAYDYDEFGSGGGVWRLTEEIVKDEATGTKSRWVVHDYETGTGNREETEFVLSTIGGADNPVITMDYDTYGMLWKQWDAEGHSPTITLYDTETHSFPSQITNPAGHVVEYTYDYSCGKKDSYTDENDNITEYDYDAFGRLTDIEYPAPDGGDVAITYSNYAGSTSPFSIEIETQENAATSMISFDFLDGLGRKIQNTRKGEDSQWITTRMMYDDMGRNYKTAGPFFYATSSFVTTLPGNCPYEEVSDYDDRSRPTEVKKPDGQNTWQVVGYEYDGFKTTITDPDNRQKTQERDYLDRIIRMIEHGDSDDYHTVYTYNAAGDLLTVRKYDGDESTTLLYQSTMVWDNVGRKTAMDDPDMGEWDYTYDKNNNLKTQTDAKNQTMVFDYDSINRITSKEYPATTPYASYTYDLGTNGIGHPYTTTRDAVDTTYTAYDTMGRLTSETKEIDSVSYTTQYGYDLSGKRIQVTYPDSTVVDTSYHPGSGLIDQVYSGSTVYAELSGYTPAGKMGTLDYDNGAQNTWIYDALSQRLITIETQDVNQALIQDRSYTYSAAGDITQVADDVNGVTYNYGYDSLHRLISETGTGNYTVPASMAMVYGYNDASHLNAVTDIDLNGTNRTFSYDLNGNMTGGYDLTDPAAVVSRGISYTADNMPAAIIRGAATTSFIYDGDGRRAKKTAGSNTTVYVNDLYEIINAAATKYIFAGNLRIAKITGTDIKYFHKDHLGSSTVMTGASGLSVETSEYMPYGGNRDQSGTSVSDYKFTDQELDTSTGLYNYDARLYDPVVGRFITPDTVIPDIYNPQDLNRYSYVRNNPLKYTDPTGHYRDFGMGNDVVGKTGLLDTENEEDQVPDATSFEEEYGDYYDLMMDQFNPYGLTDYRPTVDQLNDLKKSLEGTVPIVGITLSALCHDFTLNSDEGFGKGYSSSLLGLSLDATFGEKGLAEVGVGARNMGFGVNINENEISGVSFHVGASFPPSYGYGSVGNYP